VKIAAIAYGTKDYMAKFISATSDSELIRMSIEDLEKGKIPLKTDERELLHRAKTRIDAGEVTVFPEGAERNTLEKIYDFLITNRIDAELKAFEKKVDSMDTVVDHTNYFKANDIPYYIAVFENVGFDTSKPHEYVLSEFEQVKGFRPTNVKTFVIPDFEEDPPEPKSVVPVSIRTIKKNIYDKMHPR